ncbi:hypothetical protein [Variovorax sp. PMC12]|uniref:hypothetical protein n=1 Tax=Variovorax sp. PMC12 TaxID=2126319 RepID=UPI0018FE3690|nr:hypothetical protein [Variovorax sp. PMC12]
MSNYRDDSQDTAVASDSTWIRLTAITEDAAKIVSLVLFGLLAIHTDSATASDEESGSTRYIAHEQVFASDAVLDGLRARDVVSESVAVGERLTERLRVLHLDSAAAADSVIDRAGALVADTARISDEALGQRRVRTLVIDAAKIYDFSGQFASVMVVDQAVASDWAGGRVHAQSLAVDTAVLADETFDARQAAAAMVIERVGITSAVLDHLHARDLVIDVAVAEGGPMGEGAGQAWTANTETWAMSRYAPYTFTSVAVIDGVLYGVAEDGVHALDGGTDPITGRVATGKLDIGQGVLVHPLAAYLEYELDGTAKMDVTTTQSGTAETYGYPLAEEPAGELTNGRFIFGRGLRGRHFSFVLRLIGQRALVNDLRVETAPTKRRV